MPAIVTKVYTRVNAAIPPSELPTGHYKFDNILGQGPNKSYTHKNVWYAIADYGMVGLSICAILIWIFS